MHAELGTAQLALRVVQVSDVVTADCAAVVPHSRGGQQQQHQRHDGQTAYLEQRKVQEIQHQQAHPIWPQKQEHQTPLQGQHQSVGGGSLDTKREPFHYALVQNLLMGRVTLEHVAELVKVCGVRADDFPLRI